MKTSPAVKQLPSSVSFAVGIVAALPLARVATQAQRAVRENDVAIASAVLTSVDLDYVPSWARPVIEGALRDIDALEAGELQAKPPRS